MFEKMRLLFDHFACVRACRSVSKKPIRRAFAYLVASAMPCVAASVLSCLLTSTALAAETPITFRGTTVWVDGDPIITSVGDSTVDGELILVYTNSAPGAVNTLRTDKKIEARVLLVGGGGAGGFGEKSGNATNPAGGGGGGGEVLELDSRSFEQGLFTFTVGAGGQMTTAAGSGQNGGASSITAPGLDETKALGGGGGGAKSAGNGGDDVATGGGGASNNAGGVGRLGEGSKGGASTVKATSGGGGGAGGPGQDSSSGAGGAGGLGVASDIWLDGEENRRFGGGGGGGTSKVATGASGHDGGGSGGSGNTAPTPGLPNTGGGGGGGGRAAATSTTKAFEGAAGGSGIVIIRLTYVEIPITWQAVEVNVNGRKGHIFIDSEASWSRVDGHNLGGDIVITYTKVNGRSGLRFYNPENPDNPLIWAKARILAVGGGGGGGCIQVAQFGGGAGGGAGGVVEKNDLVITHKTDVSIEVGKGGAGGNTHQVAGSNGGVSVVKFGGTDIIEPAQGGGGGGAHSEGLAGGSGGGGSVLATGGTASGGAGTSGQGFDGGVGANAWVGAGGGGAGGAGGDTASDAGATPGAGGVGRESDITGQPVVYAGGGGGASFRNTLAGGLGGDGGGGRGAGATGKATNGVDGLGGGGGGGTSQEYNTSGAGKGGDGVVIIRLSGFVVGKVEVPDPNGPFTYDGNEHRGVPEFFAYEQEGSVVATNADRYAVTLRINGEMPDSFTWADSEGGSGPRTLYWLIHPLPVERPSAVTGHIFGNATLDDEEAKWGVDTNATSACHYDLADRTCSVFNEDGQRLKFCTLSGEIQTNAGPHTMTATLITDYESIPNVTNFVWKDQVGGKKLMDPWEIDWFIAPQTNCITSLAIDNWQSGAPAAQPQCNWLWQNLRTKYPTHYPNEDKVEYQWREKDGAWQPSSTDFNPPTEFGDYELRAFIPADSNHSTGNWEPAEKIIRFCVWEHPSHLLADYVDIMLPGPTTTYTPPDGQYTNFPVLVRLKEPVRNAASGAVESGIPGFYYADVRNNGRGLRFVALPDTADTFAPDTDAVRKLQDVLLPYDIQKWDPNGESLVWVRVPKAEDGKKIRLYWHLRDGARQVDDLLPAETWAGRNQIDFTTRIDNSKLCVFSLVNQLQRDGERAWVNWWSQEPWFNARSVANTDGGRYWRMSPTTPSLDPLVVTNQYFGKLAIGNKFVTAPGRPLGKVNVTYRKMPSGETVSFPTELGAYTIQFTIDQRSEASKLPYIGDHVCYDGDRVINIEIVDVNPQPMNPSGESPFVTQRILLVNDDMINQDAPNNYVTNQSYWCWSHENQKTAPIFTNGTSTLRHRLLPGTEHVLTNEQGITQWKLKDIYVGNVMTTDNNATTSKRHLSGMRGMPHNTKTAKPSTANPSDYDKTMKWYHASYMVLRNAGDEGENTGDDFVGAGIISPWYTNGIGTVYFDAVNCCTTNPAAFRLQVEVSTNAFDEVHPSQRSNIVWQSINEIYKFRHDGTNFHTRITGNFAELNESGGVRDDCFFRIVAPINRREPMRFRIRRISYLPAPEGSESVEDDWHGFIAVDNVIASRPIPEATLKTRGWYDPTKRGKQVAGWESAHTVDYPSATTSDLTALADFEGDISAVTSARCYYRWRNLNGAFYPERTRLPGGQWRDNFAAVYLNLEDGIKGLEPFDLPGLPGDLEYYFDLTASLPYYEYCDYTGVKNAMTSGDYTEEAGFGSLSRRSQSEGTLPSQGTDWFVRLREGESGFGAIRLLVKDGNHATSTLDMYLSSDHVWRGYLKTPKEMAGKIVSYRLEADRVLQQGATSRSIETTYWVAGQDLPRAEDIPASPIVSEATADDWRTVYVDASTGHLMFQLDDRSRSLTIAHADYQDFNGWTDAVSTKDPPMFVGSDIKSDRPSGVSSKKRRDQLLFDGWTDTPDSHDLWREPFENRYIDVGTITGGYVGYTPFDSAITPNGWTANSAMWTSKFYRPIDVDSQTRSGLAVQLIGGPNRSGGFIHLPSPSPAPRGLGTITYTARVAQGVNFEDFNWAEIGKASACKKYTLMTRAAFDLNENKNFAGNASLSMVALYRGKDGCYEMRWEQLKGSWNETKKEFTNGPQEDSQRLCLYRWAKNSHGVIEAELLGAVTNNTSAKYRWTSTTGSLKDFDINVTGNSRVRQPKAHGFSGNDFFLPMYLSVEAKGDETIISAGVRNAGGTSYQECGVSPSEPDSALTNAKYLTLYYRDTSAKRLNSGYYGLLSANCEAVFLQPTVFDEMATPTGFDDYAKAKNQLCVGVNKEVNFNGNSRSCRDELADEDWALDPERLMAFDNTSLSSGAWGLCAPTPSVDLDLWIVRAGGTDTKFGTHKVSGFGTNLSAGEMKQFDVQEVADTSFELRARSDLGMDIIISDVGFTQWRGDNFGEGDTITFALGDANMGYPSNILFTTGLIVPNTTRPNGHKVRLSAKRTPVGKPAGVRAPFYDGQYNRDGSQRGIGLGMISIDYENAQQNVNLLVQVATNIASGTDIRSYNQTTDTNMFWTTVTNIDFRTASFTERRNGIKTVFFGRHGVPGMARVILDPDVVGNVQSNKVTDPMLFGEIDITRIIALDEPTLETGDWWGWNMRTTAFVPNSVQDDLRSYLPDADDAGLSAAINAGLKVADGVAGEDAGWVKERPPFVQTPTFTNNIVGEVSFRARRYDNGENTQPAEVYLYGASAGVNQDEANWQPLHRFVVSNTTYEAYSFRSANAYSAFRLVVTDVEGVVPRTASRLEYPAVRVLIDEVTVSESVNPEMGFLYVYPFRDGLNETTVCTNVVKKTDGGVTPLKEAQPLLGESWTVQAEILPTKLPDEIDMTEHPPRVIFHWYTGSDWGYTKWRTYPSSKGHYTAELALADGESMVFRGSITSASAAIVPATAGKNFRIVQYGADVIYHTVEGGEYTNSLALGKTTSWVRPPWYAPVDYNDGKPAVSAYTILDTIAPNRAWINEVNIYDPGDTPSISLAETNQYIEIAVPELQSLNGWRLDYISYGIQTNTLCRFADNPAAAGYVKASKDTSMVPADQLSLYRTNDYVFLTVQSPETKKNKVWDHVPGAIDGTWANFDTSNGKISYGAPFALRLVRPSNIVEQEIVLEGTNVYPVGRYDDIYNPTNWLKKLEATMPGGKSQLYYVGHEFGSTAEQSLGVVSGTGATSNDWSCAMKKTPGRVNEGQIVPPNWVLYSNGELMIVRAQIGPNGHVRQSPDGSDMTDSELLLIIKKGSEGTNLVYEVKDWWEVSSLTANGVPYEPAVGKTGIWTYEHVGAQMSNDVTIVINTQPRVDLRETYGLTPDNRYTSAVMAWLEGGKNYFGESFKNPGGEIHLAKFHRAISYAFVTNLSLTTMYWLDMDPTEPGQVLRAGYTNYEPFTRPRDDGRTLTHHRFEWMGQITNELTGVAYAPYILRGARPGETSDNYTGPWTNVSFKVTGDLQNHIEGRMQWIPLRWFVFAPKSGAMSKVGASASFDENFKAKIDIWDPHDESHSPFTRGWEAFWDTSVFFRGAIDDRGSPMGIEVLKPNSTYIP